MMTEVFLYVAEGKKTAGILNYTVIARLWIHCIDLVVWPSA